MSTVLETPWWLYLAECGDGTLYTGIARDVAARIAQHNAGRGARYTRGRAPVQLLAKAGPMPRGDALRLEVAVKRLPRADKLAAVRREARARRRGATRSPAGRPGQRRARRPAARRSAPRR